MYGRLGQFDPLPPELLLLVLGHLDARTLCTARLVCRPFSHAARACVPALGLSADDLRLLPETDFSRFSTVNRVTIHGVTDADVGVRMLAHPKLCDIVSELKVVEYNWFAGFNLPPLPNLTSMTVVGYAFPQWNLFPTTLQQLVLDQAHDCSYEHALDGLARLTSLRVSLANGHNSAEVLAVPSALRKLVVRCKWSRMPCLRKLTLLTHFTWDPVDEYPREVVRLGTFTRLQNLAHLGIVSPITVDLSEPFASTIARITTLNSFDLGKIRDVVPRWRAEAATSLGLLSLTCLRLNCRSIDVSLLPRMALEGLQHLTLWHAALVSGEGFLALWHATGLTELGFFPGRKCISRTTWFHPSALSHILSPMSRLQALSVQTTGVFTPSLSSVVGLLGGLTRLSWAGGFVTDAELEECAGLSKLCTLSLLPNRPACPGSIPLQAVCKLAERPQLSTLVLSDIMGIKYVLTADLITEINSGRRSRGWPPLHIRYES